MSVNVRKYPGVRQKAFLRLAGSFFRRGRTEPPKTVRTEPQKADPRTVDILREALPLLRRLLEHSAKNQLPEGLRSTADTPRVVDVPPGDSVAGLRSTADTPRVIELSPEEGGDTHLRVR